MPRERERSWEPRDLREDYGQADYSRDYVYDRRRRMGYRVEADSARRDDFGQADFSRDWVYDKESRTGVRRDEAERDERRWRDERGRGHDDDRSERRLDDPRTWFGHGGRDRDDDRYETRGYRPNESAFDRRDRYGGDRRRVRGHDSDAEIRREILARLADERRLDPRDIEVDVRGGEVILRGVVDDGRQRRRVEDLADVSGVAAVHNELAVRERHNDRDRYDDRGRYDERPERRDRGSSWRRSFGLSD